MGPWLAATGRAALKSPWFLSSEGLEALPLRVWLTPPSTIKLPSVASPGAESCREKREVGSGTQGSDRVGSLLLRTAVSTAQHVPSLGELYRNPAASQSQVDIRSPVGGPGTGSLKSSSGLLVWPRFKMLF